LTPVLADGGDGGFGAVRELLQGRARDDLPRVALLDAALREVLEGRGGARPTVRLTELFDRLVAYRNRELGHGATGLQREPSLDQVGRALLDGVPQLLARLDVLAGGHLYYLGEISRQPSGRLLLERYDLHSEVVRRLEPLDLDDSEATRKLLPWRLYV